MAINFSEVLNKKIDAVERPPLIPIGLYRARVSKIPAQDTISDGRFDVVDFTLQLLEPVEVDEDELAAFGPITSQTVLHRFMFNTEDQNAFDRSLFNLRRFLEDHLRVTDGSDDIKSALDNSVNSECLVQVAHRPDPNDAEIKYVQVRRTAPVE